MKAVKEYREQLKALGFYTDLPEDIPDPRTIEALKEFQRSVGLEANGIYDKETEQKLFSPVPVNSESIMNYLAKAEGDYIHFNKGEKDITSAYGIYRYSFPNAEIFKFYESLGLGDLRYPTVRGKVREVIQSDPDLYAKERQLAFDFYIEHFIDPNVVRLLDDKTELTFFSIAVNGGRKRGAKALQSAIRKLGYKIVVDGIVGARTLTALEDAIQRYGNAPINAGMITYMRGFYERLIKRNPDKYARYTRGWENRMRGLA